MPAGAQSLTPATPAAFGTFADGNLYKGSIDACLSVYSQTGGFLYVTPNSPAAMSVLVDTQFSYMESGVGYINNEGGSPATVTVVAPGVNSYYATVYWDQITNACGVVYGPTAASPNAVVPDQTYQIPIATILIASSTVSITASMINDVRTWITSAPLVKAIGSVGVNQTVICLGARNVFISITITAAVVLTLSYLSNGASVYITVTNSSGGVLNFKVGASTPAGLATYTTNFKVAGVASGYTSLSATGIAINAGSAWIFQGATVNNLLLFTAG